MIYQLDHVSKDYRTREGRVHALADFSLSVQGGERLALIGKSGVGKTTLFRLLNATLRPSGGVLRFDGREVGQMSTRELRAMRRRVGTVYQQHYLVPSLSVLDNALTGRLGHWSLWQTVMSLLRPSGSDVQEAEHALELVGLADRRRGRADALSGGQQQRLAIARMLMQEPDVILADEPVASLDPGLADSIINLLLRLAEDGGRTLLVALHNVELALRYFPRIVALRRGGMAFDVEAASLNRETLDEFYTEEDAPLREGERSDGNKLRPRCAV
jgi:phosphonate transport system ATP-binding protein